MSSEPISKRLNRLEKAVLLLIQMHQFDIVQEIPYPLVEDRLLPVATELMAIQKKLQENQDKDPDDVSPPKSDRLHRISP